MSASPSIFAMRDAGTKVRVYQVDVTNRCNATCWYCPQPGHERARGDMDLATFECVLDIAENRSFHLHHFSEPLLNRHLAEMVSLATARGFRVGFSTNGRLLSQTKLDDLAARGLAWVRLHTTPFNVRLSEYQIPEGLVMTEHRVGDQGPRDAPEKPMVSYAGHIENMNEASGARRCSYLGYPDGKPWRVVLWNGDLGLCCVDVEGTNDKKLCGSCRGFVFKGPEDWGNYDGEAVPAPPVKDA